MFDRVLNTNRESKKCHSKTLTQIETSRKAADILSEFLNGTVFAFQIKFRVVFHIFKILRIKWG